MTGPSVSVNKATLDAVKQKLTSARDALKNDSVVMKQVAVYLDQWVQRNFQSKGGKAGGWAPYKYGGRIVPKRKASGQSMETRRYIDGSAVMLQDTGVLRHSFLPFIRKGVAGIGSDLPYSQPHEEGTEDLPQRRMLPRNEDVEVDVQHILDNFVKVSIRRAQ